MSRHRSYWIWAGEFLHPSEHAARFPHAALAFAVLRETRPGDDALATRLRVAAESRPMERTGDGAYLYRTYYARLERAAALGDSAVFTRVLAERPGELARRLDHAVRLGLAKGQSPDAAIEAYVARAPAVSTPVLATLLGLLPTRAAKAPVRLFWPKGQVAKGVSRPDERPTLPESVIAPLVEATRCELLRRLGAKPAFRDGLVDSELATIDGSLQRAHRQPRSGQPAARLVAAGAGGAGPAPLPPLVPAGGRRRDDRHRPLGSFLRREPGGMSASARTTCLQAAASEGIARAAGDLRDAP